MIALSVRTWLITQLLGYSYYYCRHTKLRAITQSNINSKLVLDRSARTETKIMALQDCDQNKAHEKNIHSRAPPPNSLLRRSLY
ncbi:Uncharacterized protein HZ326_1321 [Fusarium oxysporum f. sp. albedinis]|nr:Uncharacterized protein HZ326_1321 [Fusarium oxysporum f. sp. albedinis]